MLFILFISTFTIAGEQIEDLAYLKDDNRNRIFIVSFTKNITEDQIKEHARKLPHTDWRMTSAYYFLKGSNIPAGRVQSAKNISHANTILYESNGVSKWHYAHMKGIKGIGEFVDCTKDPQNGLCRP